jgi:hypothetical protein
MLIRALRKAWTLVVSVVVATAVVVFVEMAGVNLVRLAE